MSWRPLQIALVGAAVVFGGCSDERSPFAPRLDPENVVGVYHIVHFSFDPDGSIPGVDIAERLDPAIPPQLVVALDLTFQFAFRDPATKRFETINGNYETLVEGVRFNFQSRQDSEKLLMPQRLDLTYSEEAGKLSFDGSVTVALDRLVEFVPEYGEEQFPNPVRGRLKIEFRRSSPD